MLLDVIVLVVKSLDLRVVCDLRDALLFNVSFECRARAKEMVNLTCRNVTVLGDGAAVKLDMFPFKNSTNTKSTHSCQVGRRAHPQLRIGGLGGCGLHAVATSGVCHKARSLTTGLQTLSLELCVAQHIIHNAHVIESKCHGNNISTMRID